MNPHGYTDLSGFLAGLTDSTLEKLNDELWKEWDILEELRYSFGLSQQQDHLRVRNDITRQYINRILGFRYAHQQYLRERGRV